MTEFPIVPGHEIVGKTSRVADSVEHLSLGQRVGVGPLGRACFTYEVCPSGNENLCASARILFEN